MNMELRAESFKRLVNLLKDAGVYEEGMDEEEMLQLVDVMQMSMIDSCQMPVRYLNIIIYLAWPNLCDIPQESELEFLSLQPNNLHSSTLIVAPPVPASNVFDAWGSPPTEPIYLTVQALVHHAMDWSPSKREGLSRSRKRSSTDNNPPLSEPSAKPEQPYNPNATPVSLNQHDVDDSGVSWEEVSLSSVSDGSSMPSIGEIPSGYMVSTSSVAVSEFSESHEETSRGQIYE
ncbi:uncharacterized protein LOC110183989 isoform X2 [Drosophila serrata]|uniref:uncharacterized protein LOC110183989 isoform X2 n=1 Tax=Drosophila serrata TaxID=7274 RepID=UPI000A1CFE14|nr:uncharacterized protein LOC110183989 isoform X2 [Drosophila serrata]